MARRRLTALLLLFATGCGPGWQAAAPCDSRLLNPRQQVRVWAGQRSYQLHGLRISADSVSGIPYLQPLGCDSCRVVFQSAEIDSIQTGDPPGGFWGSVTVALVVLLVVWLWQGGWAEGGT